MVINHLRQPRVSTDIRGKPIRDFMLVSKGADLVKDITSISDGDPRFNTQATAVYGDDETTIVWYRMDLLDVFKSIFDIPNPSDVVGLRLDRPFNHPMNALEIIKILNSVYKMDFELNDLTITRGSRSDSYILAAKPDSVGYTGRVEIAIGEKYDIELFNAPPVTAYYEVDANKDYRIWQQGKIVAEGLPKTLPTQVSIKGLNFEVEIEE